MIKWLKNILRRITGVSTPFGGISWDNPVSLAGSVPTFTEPICITLSDNDDLISFLEANRDKIIFLNTTLDASVTLLEQCETVEKENIDIDLIVAGTFEGVQLPLPNREGGIVSVAFYFSKNHILKYSAGGTGIVTTDINGFFEVSRTLHGGPSKVFHLKEVDAPLELKFELLNRKR